jgi:hypothetical protein
MGSCIAPLEHGYGGGSQSGGSVPLEFTLTLLELLLSSRKEDVPPQVVEVDMHDRSVMELAHGLRRQTSTLRSTIDWASPSICEDVDKRADLQEQGLCAHASTPLTTLLILEALHATEHLLQIIKDHTRHVELIVVRRKPHLREISRCTSRRIESMPSKVTWSCRATIYLQRRAQQGHLAGG